MESLRSTIPLCLFIACLLFTCDVSVSAFQTPRAGCGGCRRVGNRVPAVALSAFQAGTRRRKKSVSDRTPEEASSLIRDVVQAAVDAGPRAGPLRALQAYRAVDQTLREYLPQLFVTSSGGGIISKVPEILRKLFERMGATYVKLG
jgi:hypothetical protein